MSQESIRTLGRELSLSDLPKKLAALHEYWCRKRGLHLMPCRDDIDPLELRELLGWLTLVDIRPTSPQFIYRLVGTELGYRESGPKEGASLDEILPVTHREVLRNQYQQVAASGLPTAHENTVERGPYVLVYRRLTLPLGADRRTSDVLLLGYDKTAHELASLFRSV